MHQPIALILNYMHQLPLPHQLMVDIEELLKINTLLGKTLLSVVLKLGTLVAVFTLNIHGLAPVPQLEIAAAAEVLAIREFASPSDLDNANP